MKKLIALTASTAALGYAKEPTQAKMPEAGTAAATPAPAAAKPAKVAPEVTGVSAISITLPDTGRRGGQQSAYPFDSLEVGQFFGVKNKTKEEMASALTNANRKGKQEVTDPSTGAVQKITTRHFVSFDVTPEIAKQIEGDAALAGSKVLVQRDK